MFAQIGVVYLLAIFCLLGLGSRVSSRELSMISNFGKCIPCASRL